MANLYGRRDILPICPLLKEVVNKDTFPNIPDLPKKSRRDDSILRILKVFRELIARQKPTKEFITWCAHRENVLQDCMKLVDRDLKLLPKWYEKDYPDTSKELKKLINRLYAEVLMYKAAHKYPLYMLPPVPDEPLKDFRDVLAWQNEKENLDMAGCLFHATKGISEMIKLICHYPASAIETMNKIFNELFSLEKINIEKDKEEKAKLLYKKLVETKPQAKGGQGGTDDIAIEDKELTILVELADGSDKTFSQVEIEAATNIKRGTIKDKLPRLESIGLIHRPLGKRKGYQITDKGKKIAHRNE